MPRHVRGLLFVTSLALAGPAAAQLPYDPTIVGVDATALSAPGGRPMPDFRMPRGDLGEAPGPRRNGLIAAMPLSENVTLGVGRFSGLEPSRRRTYLEREPAPTDLRRRERGIAAVGVSVRF